MIRIKKKEGFFNRIGLFRQWSRGDLQCKWSMKVYPPEQYNYEMKKKLRGLVISTVFFILPSYLLITFMTYYFFYNMFNIYVRTALLFMAFYMVLYIFAIIIIAIIITCQFKKKSVQLGLYHRKNEDINMIIKNYLRLKYGNHLIFKKKRIPLSFTYPPIFFTSLDNGLVIRFCSGQHLTTRLWINFIAIGYTDNNWKQALSLQKDLDHFLYDKRIAKMP